MALCRTATSSYCRRPAGLVGCGRPDAPPVLRALQRHIGSVRGVGTAAAVGAVASNPVMLENQLPGSPSTEWDINGCGDPTIQGFATRMSVLPGETLELKVLPDAPGYRVDLYRLGYYGGLGARKVGSVEPCVALPQAQPPPLVEAATGLVDCGNWAVSARWTVPAGSVSGLYVARLTRPEPSDQWRQDHTQTAGGAWMTGTAAGEAPPPSGRLPSHDIDDEARPEPGRPGWEHSYAANGLAGALRNPLREPRASHVYFVVRESEPRAAVLVQTNDTTWQVSCTSAHACAL